MSTPIVWTITASSTTAPGIGKEKQQGDRWGEESTQPPPFLFVILMFFQAFCVVDLRLLSKRAYLHLQDVLLLKQASKGKTQEQREGSTSLSHKPEKAACYQALLGAQNGKLWFPSLAGDYY